MHWGWCHKCRKNFEFIALDPELLVTGYNHFRAFATVTSSKRSMINNNYSDNSNNDS